MLIKTITSMGFRSALFTAITSILVLAASSFASDKRSELPKGKFDRKGIVFIFVMHDCPIANSYAPELGRIIKKYAPDKFDFFLVYPELGITMNAAKRHAKQYGYTCQVLIDPNHKLVKKIGATVTPEAAVLTPNGLIAYRGRIDDTYYALGKRRYEATVHDLRNALDTLQRSPKVKSKFTKPIGCFIPDLPVKPKLPTNQ